MTQAELIAKIAKQTKQDEKLVRAFLDSLEKVVTKTVVKHEKITLPGFLTFEPKERAERNSRNPRTGEAIVIPAQYSLSIKAGSRLKAAVKES